MIEYALAGMDLAEVRFAISPLNEVSLSLRALREPGRYPLHLPWLQTTAAAREHLDLEMLLALTNTSLWTPDFITPRPRSPLTDIDEELAIVASTPSPVLRRHLAEVHPDAMPEALAGRADRVLGRIVAALADYWEGCFEPWWPRMRAVLEADVVHRGRVMAREGLAAMFADISERLRLVDNVLEVVLNHPVTYRRSTAGEGLTMVPSLFPRAVSAPVTANEAPLVMYGARGVGTLWEPEPATRPLALARLVGDTRAHLLAVLESPASSTELGVRLGVTTSAVNQHLRTLYAAGLLTSARHGRSVLYLRSELGDRLVSAGGP